MPGGSTKKFNIKQIIKTASCFAVIALVLLVSLTVPAKAVSWTSLSLEDHIDTVYTEGTYKCVRYDFGIVPLIQYRSSSTGYTSTSTNGIARIATSTDGESATFRTFPLGAVCISGPSLGTSSSGGIAIDVSDYRNDASVTFSSTISLNLDISYNSYDQAITENIHVDVGWLFAGYNSTGGYCGTHSSTSTFYNVTLQDTTDTFIYDLPMTIGLGLNAFTDDISYIVPICNVVLTITQNNSDISINYLEFEFNNFMLMSRTSMLLEQSETLKAVENQLDELNDKTDVIINGTPEQNQTAESGLNKAQSTEQDVYEMMSQLDEMGEYDTSSAFNTINNFLQSPGWSDVHVLLSPLIDWEYSSTLMLITAAFATISIILFGR